MIATETACAWPRKIELIKPLEYGPAENPNVLRELDLGQPKALHMWDFRLGELRTRDMLRVPWLLAGGKDVCPFSAWRKLSLPDAEVLSDVANEVLDPWLMGDDQDAVERPEPPWEYTLRVPIPSAKDGDEPTRVIRIEEIDVGPVWDFPVIADRTFGHFLELIGACSKWPLARVKSLRNEDAAYLARVAGQIARPFLR